MTWQNKCQCCIEEKEKANQLKYCRTNYLRCLLREGMRKSLSPTFSKGQTRAV